jgi:hypothetical protein
MACDARDPDGTHWHGPCDLCATPARACCRHCEGGTEDR